MSPTVALIRHEAGRWRAVWAISAALLALVLLAPLLPNLESYETAEVWSSTGLVLSLLFGLGGGLLMGAHLLGTEALRGELGFYLSLPISTARFWSIRVGVAWATLVLSVAVVGIPTLATWSVVERLDALGMSGELGYGWLVAVAVLSGPTVLLTLGHALGIGARARTPWLGVDALGLVLVGALTGWSGAVLLGVGAWKEAALVTLLLAAFSLLALGLGGWRQLDGARTDVARLARLESLWTWGVLGAGAVAITGLSVWWISVTPADLTRVHLYQAGPGIAYVTGEYRWRPSYRPMLLIRGEGEEFLRFHGVEGHRFGGYGVVESFSADGSVGLMPGRENPYLLRSVEGTLELQPLGNLPAARHAALDAGGERLALALQGRIVVAEGPDWLPTRELRVPATPARPGPEAIRLHGDRLVWLGWEARARNIRVFDLDDGSLVHRFEIPATPTEHAELGPGGVLVVVSKRGGAVPWELEIWETATGSRIATLDDTLPPHWRFAPDGSFVSLTPLDTEGQRAPRRLRIYRASPEPALDTILPGDRPWNLGGWTGDGRVVLVAWAGVGQGGPTRLVALDPTTGEKEAIAEAPASLAPAHSWSSALPSHGLWLEDHATGDHWRYDPDRGVLERVFPRR